MCVFKGYEEDESKIERKKKAQNTGHKTPATSVDLGSSFAESENERATSFALYNSTPDY